MPLYSTIVCLLNMEHCLQRRSQTATVINLILMRIVPNLILTTQHESNRGKEYTTSLLTDHHRRIFNMLRMRLEIFDALLD